MSIKLKTFVLLVKFVTAVIICRPFGSLMRDIAGNYEQLTVQQLRKLEKLSTKCKKAELDLQFLRNCKTFGVYPKFTVFPIPPQHQQDASEIRKRLLKSAINRRTKERFNLEKERRNVSDFVQETVSGFDFYILQRALSKNVEKFCESVVKLTPRNCRI